MAEAHKFVRDGLAEAVEVFPDLPWQRDGDGKVAVFNEKDGEWAPVEDGQYIVKIADRYEVHDEEPAKAKAAEPKKADAKDSDKDDDA
jgi:hypothetical protein